MATRRPHARTARPPTIRLSPQTLLTVLLTDILQKESAPSRTLATNNQQFGNNVVNANKRCYAHPTTTTYLMNRPIPVDPNIAAAQFMAANLMFRQQGNVPSIIAIIRILPGPRIINNMLLLPHQMPWLPLSRGPSGIALHLSLSRPQQCLAWPTIPTPPQPFPPLVTQDTTSPPIEPGGRGQGRGQRGGGRPGRKEINVLSILSLDSSHQSRLPISGWKIRM